MIDEEEDRGPFDVIIGIACPTSGLETPFQVTRVEFDKFISNSGAMELPNPVYLRGSCGYRNANARLSELFDGERDTCTVDRIATNYVENLGILLARRPKCSSSVGHIVEQVFDSDLSSWASSTWFWVWALSRFGWSQFAIGIMCLPCTARFCRFRSYSEMGNVTDAS